MNNDELYMERAIALALNGLGNVSPNPLVGCVIVKDGQIIGEGWHRKFGEAHAEVLAINQVADKADLKGATMYVTLEPCSHHGKTPPCATRIIDENIGRVVISVMDTNPLVAGKGIEKMKASGISVELGCLKEKGSQLNRRFFTFMEKQRPYVILKWAETEDGFIARNDFSSKWISDEHSRKLVHKWRSEEDAILVGTNTAHYDNPSLTVRDWQGRNPIRVVIDKNLKLDDHLHLFDHHQQTICYNLLENKEEENLQFVRLSESNFIPEMLTDLASKNVQSLIIEGGAKLLQSFIDQDLWDEARIFKSLNRFEEGIAAPEIDESYLASKEEIVNDSLLIFHNRD